MSSMVTQHKQSRNKIFFFPNVKLYLLPFLIILSSNLYLHVTTSSSPENFWINYQEIWGTHVNNFPPYTPPMTIHCKSKDDDLQEHSPIQLWLIKITTFTSVPIFVHCSGVKLHGNPGPELSKFSMQISWHMSRRYMLLSSQGIWYVYHICLWIL